MRSILKALYVTLIGDGVRVTVHQDAPALSHGASWRCGPTSRLGGPFGPKRAWPGPVGSLPGVTVHDLGQIRCAVVTAKISRVAAEQAAEAPDRAGVNVSTAVPGENPLDTQDRGAQPLIRFSPHYYNTEEKIDRTTDLVAAPAF